MHQVIDALLSLSRPAPDPKRLVTFNALAIKAAEVQDTFAATKLTFITLAESVSRIEVSAVKTKVTPDALPYVGRLAAAGTVLRDILDSDLLDLRTTVRNTRAAITGPEGAFVLACQNIEKYTKLANTMLAVIRQTVDEIEGLLDVLNAMPVVAEEFVVPPRQEFGQVAVEVAK